MMINIRQMKGLKRAFNIAKRTDLAFSTATDAILNKTFDLTPEEVVQGLDRHIIGQKDAKKAVSIALRNRWRRRHLDNLALRQEISPMNILMSGPTGSGKTEIARRLAHMTASPFLKVEATKYTEVGVFGASAESMVKDLVDVAVDSERATHRAHNARAAKEKAMRTLAKELARQDLGSTDFEVNAKRVDYFYQQLELGSLDKDMVTLQLPPTHKSATPILGKVGGYSSDLEFPPELSDMMKNLNNMLQKKNLNQERSTNFPHHDQSNERETLSVRQALTRLQESEEEKMLDEELVVRVALEKVQTNGIIFIDEIDKLANDRLSRSSNFNKGEGVQKELLALTEGCAVQTRHGLVHTQHILFIASGAFHSCTPSDLMPELQGRLPIRVSLHPLGEKEFIRILQETQYNLVEQTIALMQTEHVELSFTSEAIEKMAHFAAQVNAKGDDIGARRLATIISKVVEEVSYEAPSLRHTAFEIDAEYVNKRLSDLIQKDDLSRYIL